jgi:hypothetical protein
MLTDPRTKGAKLFLPNVHLGVGHGLNMGAHRLFGSLKTIFNRNDLVGDRATVGADENVVAVEV